MSKTMKNRNTKPVAKTVDRWTAAARGIVQEAKLGQPKGDVDVLCQMDAEWANIPNVLIEDEAGQLWLGYMCRTGAIGDEEGYEAVTVEEALTWMQHVSEFVDGYTCELADVCRIALAELARRPSDLKT